MKGLIDTTMQPRRWLSLVAMAAMLAACGGGGGGGGDDGGNSGGSGTSGGGGSGGAAVGDGGSSGGTGSQPDLAALPDVPSGYVRYQVTGLNDDGTVATPSNDLTLRFNEICNRRRVSQGLEPQPIPASLLDQTHFAVEERMYDAETGAGRKEWYLPLLTQVSRTDPLDCRYEITTMRHTKVIAADGSEYEIEYREGEPYRIRHSPPSYAAGTVVWGDDWTRRTVAGHPCTELPAGFAGMAEGALRCNWDIYRDVRVRNLPLPLEEIIVFGPIRTLYRAEFATTTRSQFGGEWATKPLDWLPEGVEIR